MALQVGSTYKNNESGDCGVVVGGRKPRAECDARFESRRKQGHAHTIQSKTGNNTILRTYLRHVQQKSVAISYKL